MPTTPGDSLPSQANALPILSSVEPVLSVQDVAATIQYWQDVIGFTTKFTWGDPPNFGAISWQNVHVQFSLNPAHAIRSKGSSVWIRVRHLSALYRFHQERKADIVAPLTNQPWGMADYTLRELNGHYVTFSGLIEERDKSDVTLPPTVRIVGRMPTIKEFQQVQAAVGWGDKLLTEVDTLSAAAKAAALQAANARAEATLAAILHAAVAEDTTTGQVVGCASLLGDKIGFYYVKDVMVHKDWQGRRIGTALMQELMRWLEENVSHRALVGLFTRDTLEPFYQQFGFSSTFAMLRYMNP